MNENTTAPPAASKDGRPSAAPGSAPSGVTGALVLADGSVFWGKRLGASGQAVGDVCFNTSMTGYQEIANDASYAGDIITFTFPPVRNVGTHPGDIETVTPAARRVSLRDDLTRASTGPRDPNF